MKKHSFWDPCSHHDFCNDSGCLPAKRVPEPARPIGPRLFLLLKSLSGISTVAIVRTELLKVVDEFNATNEYGITLTAEYAGGYGDIFTKMLPILNTAEVPDVVVAYQNQAATYQLADALWDMNEIIDDPTWGMPKADQEDFFPGFFAQDIYPTFDNARLGLPPNRSMEVMYYNMDWLNELGYDAPPATPAEFKENGLRCNCKSLFRCNC